MVETILPRLRAQRLGDERVLVGAHRDFAGLRLEERAGHADEVAHVELLEGRVGVVADHVLAHVQLDEAFLIENLHELALAHVADGHEAAGDGDGYGVVLALDVEFQRLGRKVRLLAVRTKRVLTGGTQVGELLAADGVLVVADLGGNVAHDGKPTSVGGAVAVRKRKFSPARSSGVAFVPI